MKSEAEFDVHRDLEEELRINQENRQKLFNQKFPQDIERQRQLSLNSITDSKSKSKIFDYLSRSDKMEQFQNKLKSNPFIQGFMEVLMEDDKKNTFDSQFKDMTKYLEKKARNENQPLTFYNQFTKISKQIKSCFVVRKNFADEARNQPVMEYEEILVDKIDCIYKDLGCTKTFKKLAGLNSHILFCPIKKKLQEQKKQEQKDDTCRLEKLRHKTKHIEKRRKY